MSLSVLITAGRAESWMNDYVARVALHRDEIRAETDKFAKLVKDAHITVN